MFILLDWIDIERLNWYWLCDNKSVGAIELLIKNPDKINWSILSSNEYAIDLLMENIDKIDWDFFNMNMNGVRYLKNNPTKLKLNPKTMTKLNFMKNSIFSS